VVIHNRCSKDVWFWHGEYGPACFSLYKGLGEALNGARRACAPRAGATV
jgi:hypothetical protein